MRFISLAILISVGQSTFAAIVTIGNYKYSLTQSTNDASVEGLASSVKSLENVFIPDVVTYGGIDYTVTKISADAFSSQGISGELRLPNGLIQIGDNAFKNCKNLTGQLILPKGLVSIGKYAFQSCKNLTGELKFPDTMTKIDRFAFNQCSGFIGKLQFPNSLTRLEQGVFSGCTGFSELVLTEAIQFMDNLIFSGCIGLEGKLTVPGTVKNIYSSTFEGCGFNEIIVSEGVTQMYTFVFKDCKNLRTIILPSTLKKIGMEAFYNCSNLQKVVCYAATPIEHEEGPSFSGSTIKYPFFIFRNNSPRSTDFPYNSVRLYVPEGSIAKYKQAFEWKAFKNIQAIVPEADQIQLNKGQAAIEIGENLTLTAQILPEGANKTITWISSDESVATVENGVVTAKAWGTTTITATTVNGLSASCIVSVWMKGDVNNDGVVNVADVTITSNYIAGLEPDNFSFEAADINGDGDITITDAVLIARLILNTESVSTQSAHKISSSGSGNGVMNVTRNGNELLLSLPNAGYTAFQADLRLPDGVTQSDLKLTSEYADSHVVMTADKGNNIVRLIVFSLNNSEFKAGDEIVHITLPDNSTFTIDGYNIVASYTNGVTSNLSLSGDVVMSGVESVSKIEKFSIQTTIDGILVRGASQQKIFCYAVDGRLAKSVIANSNAASIPLAPGLYVIKVGNLSEKIIIK